MRILFSGDFISYPELDAYCTNNPNRENIFGDLVADIKKTDYAGINIEFPITKNKKVIQKIGPALKGHELPLTDVEKAGFNIAYMANNHTLDFGTEGLQDTASTLINHKLNIVGIGNNRDEAREGLRLDKNGVSVTILNFAENEFSIATETSPGANGLDIIDNINDIKKARQDSNHVFVVIHCGQDFNLYPPAFLIKQLRFYAENGASAIICHHSHYIAGYENWKGVPIFYGLGSVVYPKIYENERNKTVVPIFDINKESLSYTYKLMYFEIDSMRLIEVKDTKYDFSVQFEKLSYLIANDLKINQELWYKKLSKLERYRYISLILGYNQWIFRILKRLKCLVFFDLVFKQQRSRRLVLLNLLRREVHREALLEILKREK
ncbi:CapA family protein [uncultured Bacteroides sp.]|uniref:CapA family protein n=1 Tax=uncultured Bacteroides sp. TaxID=162156 RepID=UPI002AA637EF|nr:CapA family protein [uncultured Bacteroides sp.]